MKRILSILKKALPWLVAVGIFVYLFKQYPPEQIWKAVKHANIGLFLTLAVVYFIILYFVDCFTIKNVLGRFGYPMPVKDIYPARGVTYLIMNINYPASQAAFAYYLKRVHKVPIFEALSIFFFIAIVDLYFLITIALIGSFFQNAVIEGVHIARFVQTFVLIAYGLFVLQFIFWKSGGWLGKDSGIKPVKWLKSKQVFTVFNQAKISDYMKIALMRSPIHIIIVIFLYIALKTFGAEVPLINIIASVPIAFLIGTVPITPGGLGTTNVAIIALIAPHLTSSLVASGVITAGELIFAVTIVWTLTNYTLKSLMGVVWLQKVSTQLFKPTSPEDEIETGKETTHLVTPDV